MKKNILALIIAIISFQTAQAQTIKAIDAAKHMNEQVTVCDSVYGGKFFNRVESSLTLLNVGAAYPNSPLTIVFMGNARSLFTYKPEVFLVNKNVCFTGTIKEFKGKVEIEITEVAQVKVQ
jgi:hypothetical protein